MMYRSPIPYRSPKQSRDSRKCSTSIPRGTLIVPVEPKQSRDSRKRWGGFLEVPAEVAERKQSRDSRKKTKYRDDPKIAQDEAIKR